MEVYKAVFDGVLRIHPADVFNDTATTENHQISCSVSQGKHLLTLIDNEGNQKKIQFEVK